MGCIKHPRRKTPKAVGGIRWMDAEMQKGNEVFVYVYASAEGGR